MLEDERTRVDIVRNKYQKEINRLESELQAIKNKLAILNEVGADLLAQELPLSQAKYANTKLTPAVADAVQILSRNGRITAAQVRNYLVQHGFKPGKHFGVGAYIALKRLEKQGTIVSERINKRRFYKVRT